MNAFACRLRFAPLGFLLVSLTGSGWAADGDADGYRTERNVSYRDENSPGWDDYMKERCQLDLYDPSEKKKFATVV